MSTISTTGTAVSAAKTAATVMVLALFASVAGFVTPAGPTPAAAQDTNCYSTTTTLTDGINVGPTSVSTYCPKPGTTTYYDTGKPDDHLYCSSVFGDYFVGTIPNDAELIANHRWALTIYTFLGDEYFPSDPNAEPVPWACSKRSTPPAECIVQQHGELTPSNGPTRPIKNEDKVSVINVADYPWSSPNCLTEDFVITEEYLLHTVRDYVCVEGNPPPDFVEYYSVTKVFGERLFQVPGPTETLTGSILDVDCCPTPREHTHVLEHTNGTPGKPCHPHPPPPCETGKVTYDRINGDGHRDGTVDACPDNAVGAPVGSTFGSTFDIVLDYPRRGHGVFATIGGALAPVTVRATAKNFECRGRCGNTSRRAQPVSVSFGLDLEGLNGYLEGHDNQFQVVSETFDGSRNGVDRWGRLDYSREIVAYFYRATYTNPDQRVALNIVAPQGIYPITGTYQYWMRETEDYWVDDPDHPDGGYPQSRTVTNLYPAPMTARLVDVDGDLITADTDPYYSRDNGRVELRIAGFQPVFD